MVFKYKTLVPVFVIVFGLLALSGSGTVVGTGLALLVLSAVAAPAIVLTAVVKSRKAAALRADAHDLMRMDSDKG